jgi:hypothetical protein
VGAKREDEFMGQKLPGTGGDFIDGNDVEGHRRFVPEDGSEDVARRDDGPRRYPDVEDDVEGHRSRGEPDQLYRNLPTTQGEVIRRGPGDNPHGDR